MRIAFAIDSLTAGGAERVLTNMANYWAGKGHRVEILTLWQQGSVAFYPLSAGVIHSPLSLAGESKSLTQFVLNNLRRIWVIRNAIKRAQADVLISLLDRMNVLAGLASFGLGIPLVVCEHNDPAHCRIGGPLWELLRRVTYSQVSAVVMLTAEALSYFGPVIRRRATVIPNGISLPEEEADKPTPRQCTYNIISVGRLVHQKGFDYLLQAFAQVHPKFPQWSLTIWGEGPERKALELLRDALGLEDCVELPGTTQTPFQQMKNSDLFVSSSRFEGFPMALLEAMACNLPVVGFDCPSGTREIIRDGYDGVLVPSEDVNALAKAMSQLMDNALLRQQLAKRAGEVIQRFSMEKVMGQWEELLLRLVQRGRLAAPPITVPNSEKPGWIC